MKSRSRYPLTVSLVLLALAALATPLAADTFSSSYGGELTVDVATPIADILKAPADFEGKEVRVEGEVRGVCAMAGCWMEIADSAGHEIRIKVEDGVIVFPMEAVGVNAVAQGIVKVNEMSRDEYVGWQRHLAEETGEEFDEASIGDGPYQLVQIAGSGARIGG